MERMQVYLMSLQFSKENMQAMEDLTQGFFKRMGIKLIPPVDIFEVATSLGFDVRGAEFEDQLDGLIVVNEFSEKIDGFNSNKVIAYNCFKDINTKKFIVAHELAHYICQKVNELDKRIVIAAREHADGYSDNEEEQKMDYIAASILVPKEDLLSFLNDDTSSSKVAQRYNVPEELAARRMCEVRM